MVVRGACFPLKITSKDESQSVRCPRVRCQSVCHQRWDGKKWRERRGEEIQYARCGRNRDWDWLERRNDGQNEKWQTE